MSFEARFADDPVAEASVGFDELAKGIFQLWRFFSHAREIKWQVLARRLDRGLARAGERVAVQTGDARERSERRRRAAEQTRAACFAGPSGNTSPSRTTSSGPRILKVSTEPRPPRTSNASTSGTRKRMESGR